MSNQPSNVNIARAQLIPGWMNADELAWLADTASRCMFIVEIGTYAGRSTRAMGDNIAAGGVIHTLDPYLPYAMQDNSSNDLDKGDNNPDASAGAGVVISSIDDGNNIKHLAISNLADLGAHGVVVLWHDASALLKYVASSDYLADFVFIDGAHDYASVRSDIEVWLPFIKEGGILSGHDYGVHPGVMKAVREKFDNGSVYRSRLYFPAGSIWAVKV